MNFFKKLLTEMTKKSFHHLHHSPKKVFMRFSSCLKFISRGLFTRNARKAEVNQFEKRRKFHFLIISQLNFNGSCVLACLLSFQANIKFTRDDGLSSSFLSSIQHRMPCSGFSFPLLPTLCKSTLKVIKERASSFQLN